MGSLADGLLRLLSLLLVFLLGFFSFVGILAGVGLIAYKGVTYDRLVKWGGKFGLELPSTEAVIQNPEVSLTSMTIEQAIAEVSKVKSYGTEVTIDFLLTRYGIVLPQEVLSYLPAALREAPLATLFTKDGILEVLDGVPVSLIFDIIPDGVLSPAAKAELSDKTFGDVIDHDLEYLLGDVRIGYLMAPLGITYEYVDGVYVEQYADPSNPTVLEVVAPLRLGEVLVNIKNKSDLIAVVSEDIGNALLSQLFGPLASVNPLITDILGDYALNDIIVKDEETGEYDVNVFKLISNRQVGEILGYEPVYHNGDSSSFIEGWLENGEPLSGPKLGLAFCNLGEIDSITNLDYVSILDGFYVGYALSCVPTFDEDGNIIAWTQDGGEPEVYYKNVVGKTAGALISDGITPETLLEGIYIGELMGATPVRDPLTDEIDHWEKDGKTMTGVESVMADKLVSDVMNGEIGMDDISLSTVLGLRSEVYTVYLDGETTPMLDDGGNPITRTVWVDEETGDEADHILGAIANCSIDNISSIISTLTIGDVTGNFSLPKPGYPDEKIVYSGKIDTVGGEKVYVVEKATGVLKALTDSPVNDISGAIDSVKIGDAMGLYEGDDSVWYKDAACTVPETGIQKALAPKTIGTIGDAMDDILVGDAMGYYYDEVGDKWYQDDAHTLAVTGIQKVLAPKKIGEIGGAMDEIKIGEIMGWEYITADPMDKHWISGYDASENEIPASGIMLNFADLTVNEMSDTDKVSGAVQNAKIGDAMGYYEDKSVSPSVWYTNSSKTAQPTGIMGVLADTKLSEVDTKINSTEIGTLMGNYQNPMDGKWYSDKSYSTPVTPQIMNKISDATLTNVGAVMNSLTLGDVLDNSCFEDDTEFLYYLRWQDPIEGWKYRGEIPIDQMGNACNTTFSYVLGDPIVLAKLGS